MTLDEWARRPSATEIMARYRDDRADAAAMAFFGGGRGGGKLESQRINMFYDDPGSWVLNPRTARERVCLVNKTFSINSERDQTMAHTVRVTATANIHPLTLEAAPKGGYIVRGAMYNAYDDSMRGLAFAGTLAECLGYMSEHMEEGRKAQEPKRVCDCEKAGQ